MDHVKELIHFGVPELKILTRLKENQYWTLNHIELNLYDLKLKMLTFFH